MDGRLLEEVLSTLGEVLESRGSSYEVVVIGGSGLMLLGPVTHPTGDLDALALVEHGEHVPGNPFPLPLAEGVEADDADL